MDIPALHTCPGLDGAFYRACNNFPDSGTILEFGVGGGYSYSWMTWQIVNRNLPYSLIGFDSWQ